MTEIATIPETHGQDARATMQSAMGDVALYSEIMGFVGRPKFRGEIWECYEDVPMGRGFANQGAPFDIESACYLKPVLEAIRRAEYGKFVIRAAVQMLKTHGVIEMPMGYFILHDQGDAVIYLPADQSAFDQAKSRLMPFLKSVPEVGEIIERVELENRFDITTAEFYLPGMVLRVWPLNESTTQRMTLRYVLISDAFLSGTTGLMSQAIARTTQHNTNVLKDYKIIIESQGSEVGDDFDMEWQSTNQGMLHVVCPCCGMGQRFDWHRERAEDFRAVVPVGRVAGILEGRGLRIEDCGAEELAAIAEVAGCGVEHLKHQASKLQAPEKHQ